MEKGLNHMKKLMIGNEAVARGLYEADCKFISSYPGTPSTEITEFAAEYDELYAEMKEFLERDSEYIERKFQEGKPFKYGDMWVSPSADDRCECE